MIQSTVSTITSQSKLSLNFEANTADQRKDPFLVIPTFYAPPPKLCEREAPGGACYYERLETVSEREKKKTG